MENNYCNKFVNVLVAVMRANGHNDKLDEDGITAVLQGYIHSQRRYTGSTVVSCKAIPEAVLRLEWYYAALAREIERRSGTMSTASVVMSAKIIGRAFVSSGRLIVVQSFIRNVNRFYFSSFSLMEDEAEKTIGEALDLIYRYPEVAAL